MLSRATSVMPLFCSAWAVTAVTAIGTSWTFWTCFCEVTITSSTVPPSCAWAETAVRPSAIRAGTARRSAVAARPGLSIVEATSVALRETMVPPWTGLFGARRSGPTPYD